MFCLIIIFIVAVTKCTAQSSCVTPSGSLGECKALRRCQPLLDIRNKFPLSEADSQLLKDSKCEIGSTGTTHRRIRYVCCPHQRPDDYCVTPEMELGVCLNISACDHLARMLDRFPVPVENVEYLKRSRCEGSAPFSVCCQLKPKEMGTTAEPTKSTILSRCAGTQSSSEALCSTPEGKPGRCVNISSCHHIAGMLQQKPVPQATIAYVNSSICQGSTAMSVCCPEQVERTPSVALTSDVLCVTPENNAGRCVNISACDHFVKMFENMPLSQKNYDYLKRSKCQGSYIFSVCCGPKPTDPENRYDGITVAPTTEGIVPLQATLRTKAPSCEEQNSAYPPDKNSGCCGQDSHLSTKIMGGNVTDIEEYPWLVLMKYASPMPRTCGGSLISGKYVLTAAHCVTGKHLRGINATHVIVGEYNRTSDGPDCIPVEAGAMDCTDGEMNVEIEKIILHPDGLDIALIRLKELVPYTFFYRPICLPTSDVTLSPPDSFRLIVAGWGVTDTLRVSNIKMAVDIPYVNITQCQSLLLNQWSIICKDKETTSDCQALRAKIFKRHMVCAGGQEGKDSCSGDSGGPLMHENGRTFEVIGVLSVGSTPCAKANHPAMYVKVYDNLDWIKTNIEPYVVVFL